MTIPDPFGWVGATIDGKFAVEAPAGEGAFAIVYRGRHLALDEPVAIKCLKLPAQMTERDRAGLVSSFRSEARTLHRLSRLTATIVQALDLGGAPAPSGAFTPYIVMEWLDGETLQDDLTRRRAASSGSRPFDEAMALLAPAAAAIGVAHAEGVVHRDLKPSNLFLSQRLREGAGTMLKVLDFGIARLLMETHARTAASVGTSQGVHAFTPQYAAPEQFNAQYGAAGPWTDVFSMALMVIELASGRPALEGSDLLQLYVACVDERTRPSLSRRGVDVSDAVEQVLRRAVEVDPRRRFESMDAFWHALEEANAPRALRLQLGAHGPTAALEPTLLVAGPAGGSGVATHRSAGSGSAPSREGSVRPGASSARSPGPTGSGPQLAASWGAGENRICTVVSATIDGLSALSGRLEPDQIKEVLDHCFALITERVEGMGGTVDRVLGDSVTAVFGVPRATDNDAERAVHAALGLQAALAAMSLPPRSLRSWRPTARVGIGTGRVFAGPAGTSREITVIGDAVNAAARLQQLAPEGAVLIGGGTYRQVAGLFEVEPIGTRTGATTVAASTDTFRVLRPAPQRLMATATDFFGLATELCGRSAEMVRLRDALETVRSESRASLLTLTGASGVGRSRLLAELASAVTKDGSVGVLSAQCSPLAMETSYGLWAALLRSGFHLREDDTPDEVVRKLARGLRALSGDRPTGGGAPPLDRAELEAIAAPIATLLGGDSPSPSDTHGHGRPSDAAPSEGGGANKQRLAAAAARLIGAVAARRPLLVLCDDLQWADDASLDLLDDLVLRLLEQPLFLVCATRPDLHERRPHWGEGKAAHARLELEPLARRHVEQMARDRLRLVSDLSSEFVRTLADRAEGSALILVETLHLLVDAGVVEPSVNGPWRVHESRLGALELPPTIQGVVQARLDRLDPNPRSALAQAAVIGKTFWVGAVAALRAADGDTQRGTVEAALAELRRRRLTRVREASSLPGEQELVFAESATQEVAYASLSVRVRRIYHRAAARWLEERARGDAAAALIAQQYDRGGDRRAAAVHHARAGGHAMLLGQNLSALRHLERAREIHDEAGSETPGSDGDAAVSVFEAPGDARVATWRDRTRLRLELGDVLRMLGRFDDAERAYEEARARVLRREAREGHTWQAAETLLWEARIDFRLALARKVRGDNEDARRLVERAIARAEEARTATETPLMWALLAAIHRREGDLDACLTASVRGLRVARGVIARDARFREAVSSLLVTLGGVFYSRGQLVRAERTYRQAARVVDERTQPQAASYALSDAGAVRFARGDLAGARELFLASLKLKERQGDLATIAIARSNVAEVELCLGNVDAAFAHAREAVRIARQVDARADLPDMLKNLARASLAKGQSAAALEAGMEALALAELGGGRVYLADVAQSLAEICEAVGTEQRDLARAAARALDVALQNHAGAPRVQDCAAGCRARIASLLD